MRWSILAGMVAGVLLAAPSAAVLTVTMQEPTQLLVPGAAAEALTATFAMDCASAVAAAAIAGSVTAPVDVVVEPEPPGLGTIVTGPSRVELDLSGCATSQGSFATATATYGIQVTMEWPALEESVLKLDAAGPEIPGGGGGIIEQQRADVDVNFAAAYVGIINVTTQLRHLQSGPQTEVPYTIDVKNLGNGITKVLFSLAGEAPPGWTIILPQPVVLDAPAGSQPSAQATLIVSTMYKNGENDERIAFRVVATPEAANDASAKGAPVQLELSTQVKGFYIPNPALGVLAFALLVTVAALRRRRTP